MMALPFVILLLCIAVLPLVAPHFWEKNKNKGWVVLILTLPVAILVFLSDKPALQHAFYEYASFVILLGALFVTTGGIHLDGDLEATPRTNTFFLALGSLLASLIGTTGASMLLIRALLHTNSERKNTAHIPVFFIFTVSNIGGLLTPIGDPPLFLGFLRGVPFFWTLKLFPVWALCLVLLLVVFYFLDRRAYAKEAAVDLQRDHSRIKPLKLNGKLNLIFVLGVVLSVFLPTPWREISMLLFAALSMKTTSRQVRHANHFHMTPVYEIMILFAGIFITMIPALNLLKNLAPQMGITTPMTFFWASGIMSSMLDNAPTYLAFFTMAMSLPADGSVIAGVAENILVAISCGSVLMGALTYIGNGPNFMVKSIADHRGMKTPSFFGYMIYSFLILVPIFAIVSLVFFKQ